MTMVDVPLKKPAEAEKPLPQFRQDLKLFPGPANPDGSPTYNLYDPVKASFFKINWTESLIFKLLCPNMTMIELIKAIEGHTTLKVTEDELKMFFQDAASNNLLSMPRSSDSVWKESQRLKI